MAAEGKIDPMHQFVIEPIFGSFQTNNPFVFTNSALWMLVVLGTIYVFMLGGMRRELVPGRWQVAVEGMIGFVNDMVHASIGPEGKKYLPWVFTAFIFLLFANLMGNMPFAVVPGAHPFTVTSQFTITGVMSLISFAIVLGVDRFLDMCRTTLNVVGDLVAAQVISAAEPIEDRSVPADAAIPTHPS